MANRRRLSRPAPDEAAAAPVGVDSWVRRKLVTIIRALAAIAPISVGFGALLNGGQPSTVSTLNALGTTAIVGGPLFLFEVFFVGAPAGAAFRRLPLAAFAILRLTAWGLWILAGTALAMALIWEPLGAAPTGRDYWWTVGFSIGASVLAQTFLSVDALLGRGVLVDLLVGRYFRPRVEDRAVLFLDLKGSTALAERLGDERFLELLARFASDTAAEVRAAGGRIHDYVGDEVIVTWAPRAAGDLTAAARLPLALKARIEHNAGRWQRDFGTVPAFRAALHVGPVAIGEMGDDKRAIVMLGDTMNVAARLEQSSRDLGAMMVLSGPAADRIDATRAGVRLVPKGDLPVRGRAATITVVAAEPA